MHVKFKLGAARVAPFACMLLFAPFCAVAAAAADASPPAPPIDTPAAAPTDAPADAPAGTPAEQPADAGAFHSSVYAEYHTGQMAGMNNIILHPKMVVGGKFSVSFDFAPAWRNSVDARLLYGSAQTGTDTGGTTTTGQQLLEARAHWLSLYTVYNKDDVLQFNAGLYSEFALPFHNAVPYVQPTSSDSYALEENEKITDEKLFGADFNIDFSYDRLQSSFHNILFVSGNRIGPNLLAYSPLLAFDWGTRAYLIGDSQRPKLDFYTNVQFWFARKGNGSSLFNMHDGLAGTKREIYLTYGLEYHFLPKAQVYIETYGDNNLNRGGSTSVPQDFRDGFYAGLRYDFN